MASNPQTAREALLAELIQDAHLLLERIDELQENVPVTLERVLGDTETAAHRLHSSVREEHDRLLAEIEALVAEAQRASRAARGIGWRRNLLMLVTGLLGGLLGGVLAIVLMR